jgi:hypothetical protein
MTHCRSFLAVSSTGSEAISLVGVAITLSNQATAAPPAF